VAGIAGRLLSTTASAVAKQLWSLKSAATKAGNRRPVASSFPSPILGLFTHFLSPGVPCSGSATAAVAGRSMVRYEGGYAVDTVFDGSKLGIEPHAVEITPAGDLLVLDSINRTSTGSSCRCHHVSTLCLRPLPVFFRFFSLHSWDSAKCAASLDHVSGE